MGKLRGFLLAGLLVVAFQGASAVYPGPHLVSPAQATENAPPLLVASDARLSTKANSLHLEMDFDSLPAFTFHYVDMPPRVIVDLPGTIFVVPKEAMLPQGLVQSVRYGTMGEGKARMVVTLSEPVKIHRAEAARLSWGGGARLTLDGTKVTSGEYSKMLSEQVWETAPSVSAEAKDSSVLPGTPAGPFLVAVDAGHGGIDTGATSVDGKAVEKDITLSFARALALELGKLPGVEAFLVRNDDRFLSLQERVRIARDRKANLFISLHADTLRQSDIRGATVYTISDKASDSLSASLAERENFSDELAGIKLDSEPEEVADILLDLTRRETQAFSVTLAQSVIQSFKGEIELINNPHRSAGFRVLRAPEIPSILLELGFLSNTKDQALLLDEEWRKKIAALLSEAIQHYRMPDAATGAANGG